MRSSKWASLVKVADEPVPPEIRLIQFRAIRRVHSDSFPCVGGIVQVQAQQSAIMAACIGDFPTPNKQIRRRCRRGPCSRKSGLQSPGTDLQAQNTAGSDRLDRPPRNLARLCGHRRRKCGFRLGRTEFCPSEPAPISLSPLGASSLAPAVPETLVLRRSMYLWNVPYAIPPSTYVPPTRNMPDCAPFSRRLSHHCDKHEEVVVSLLMLRATVEIFSLDIHTEATYAKGN